MPEKIQLSNLQRKLRPLLKPRKHLKRGSFWKSRLMQRKLSVKRRKLRLRLKRRERLKKKKVKLKRRQLRKKKLLLIKNLPKTRLISRSHKLKTH